jgi:hypothetical protein
MNLVIDKKLIIGRSGVILIIKFLTLNINTKMTEVQGKIIEI